ncbi:hypothetical protein TNCV_2897611 [Trichonephila clavipes]|nr:hypothetical protein TNCV_2897611 [Trichonephila clavipes]
MLGKTGLQCDLPLSEPREIYKDSLETDNGSNIGSECSFEDRFLPGKRDRRRKKEVETRKKMSGEKGQESGRENGRKKEERRKRERRLKESRGQKECDAHLEWRKERR